jgi:uncharacterized protein YbjT (DUF2867 family)
MTNEKLILVTGATGKQGGATLRHLAKHGGFKLRAMTRKPNSEAAKAAAKLGAEVVAGDLDDAASVERALDGAWGVFGVQNSWEAGVAGEEEQGKRIARLAREKGVQHFVYASVGSAHKGTGIPHFDSKFHIELTVKELGFPSHAIIRPVFFMENLFSPWSLNGDKLMMALKPTTKVQMIASDDVGKFEADAFIRADKWRGVELDVAGDELTLPETAAAMSAALGRTITFQQLPIEAVRQQSEDSAKMLEWFDAVGYSADFATHEAKWGIKPRKLVDWLREKR